MPVEYQVMIIYAATKKYLLDVPVADILRFEQGQFHTDRSRNLLHCLDLRRAPHTGH